MECMGTHGIWVGDIGGEERRQGDVATKSQKYVPIRNVTERDRNVTERNKKGAFLWKGSPGLPVEGGT